MTDIQRYKFCESCGTTNITRERRPNGNDSCLICLKKWPSKETKILIPEQDHIKAMEAKEMLCELKIKSFDYGDLQERLSSALELLKRRGETIEAQAKEIEKLKHNGSIAIQIIELLIKNSPIKNQKIEGYEKIKGMFK